MLAVIYLWSSYSFELGPFGVSVAELGRLVAEFLVPSFPYCAPVEKVKLLLVSGARSYFDSLLVFVGWPSLMSVVW